MAVAAMSKLKILGLIKERERVMNVLSKSRMFEAVPAARIGETESFGASTHLERVIGKQVRVSFAVNFLYALSEEAASIIAADAKAAKRENRRQMDVDFTPLKKSSVRSVIGYDDFYDSSAREYELLAVADALEKISFRKVDIKSEIAALKNENKSLSPYSDCPLPFSVFKDTASCSCFLCFAPSSSAKMELDGIEGEAEIYPSKGVLAAILVKKEDAAAAREKLSRNGFQLCPFSFEATAAERISRNLARIDELAAENTEITLKGLDYSKYLSGLKILYDFMNLEIEKSETELGFQRTGSVFVAEGWVPAEAAESLIAEIKKKTSNIIGYITEPDENDEPPTLLVNPAVLKPFEDVTNMYSAPSYGEADPNPFMAIFFFLFFGIMTADAGYGLVLTVGALIILKIKKFEQGARRLIALIGICGISAVAWGVLFGGYFGVELLPALWFNPINDPMMMLVVSLAAGAVQLLSGYALYAAKMIKRKNYAAAIFDTVFVFTIVGAVALMALGAFVFTGVPVLVTVGMWILLGSLIGIVFTAGHAKKGVFKKILGGFSGLYGLVNLLSDVLSYARLFGLGLASGAIALAFNTLGGLLFGIPYVGYVLGVILLIPLHLFNLGVGVLGAYVHNARLQFVEFYGKFYDGGGRLFSPMGERTRYIKFA